MWGVSDKGMGGACHWLSNVRCMYQTKQCEVVIRLRNVKRIYQTISNVR